MELFMLFSATSSLMVIISLSSSPYILLSGVMIISLSISLCVGLVYSSFLGFLVFLVYAGGIQILFLYSLSVVPEELYKFFNKYLPLLFSFIIVNLGLLFLPQPVCQSFAIMSMNYMGDPSYIMLFMCMIVILVFVMLVCCTLCNKNNTPLRKISSNKLVCSKSFVWSVSLVNWSGDVKSFSV